MVKHFCDCLIENNINTFNKLFNLLIWHILKISATSKYKF